MHSSPSPLRHHSVSPPPPTTALSTLVPTPPGRSSVSLSHLLPSSYSTDHACSKNRSYFHQRCEPSPSPPLPAPRPSTITLKHCLLSKSKSCSCSSPPSHLPIAPPQDTPVGPHPDDPHIDRHPTHPSPPILEFGGVCQRGVHQSVALS